MRFWKKSKKESKRLDCYDTIDDLPIKIWFDVHMTSDYSLLLKNHEPLNSQELEFCFECWEKMYNQYIDQFGLSEEFLEDLNQQIEIANYRADFIITGDRYLLTLIKVGEARLEMDKKDTEKPAHLETILARMSKHYGFKLNSKELTVVQYYSYLNTISNG